MNDKIYFEGFSEVSYCRESIFHMNGNELARMSFLSVSF